jgi:diphthine-ammonia ligase
LEDTEVIVTDPEPYPVAYLRVAKGKLVEKEGWTRPDVRELRQMLGLGNDEGVEGLDEAGKELLEDLRRSRTNKEAGEKEALDLSGLTVSDNLDEGVRFNKRDKWFAASITGLTRGDESIGDELRRCFDSIQGTSSPSSSLQTDDLATLTTHGLSLPLHTSHITLLLPSMSLFLPANAVYSKYFGTSPPSRATVAVPLPSGSRIRLEVVGFDDRPSPADTGRDQGRQALHVQGLSYWAPANIGPYSQAVIVCPSPPLYPQGEC